MRKNYFLTLEGKVKLFLLIFAVMPLVSLKAFADGVDNAPKEGKVFYTDNISGTRAVGETGDWELTSYVVNCFDEERVTNKEYAWGMTADGKTQLAVILKYTGDDPQYKIESQKVEFYWYQGDDIFSDDELLHGTKELITDCDIYVGKYKQETTEKSASIILTAPESFPVSYMPYYTFYVVIKVYFENGRSAAVAKNIGISRPGVLLLHGLWSDNSTFEELQDHLVNSNVYIQYQIHCGNYSDTNDYSFFFNTYFKNVVYNSLIDLSNSLFSIGFASTKYDMIGHSMGGILERLYIQKLDNQHTNKLITLNTPHFGSGWGNPYRDLKDLFGEINQYTGLVDLLNKNQKACYQDIDKFQAIYDLSINSPEILNLNSKEGNQKLYGIPVCAVGTKVGWLKTAWYVSSPQAPVDLSKWIASLLIDTQEEFEQIPEEELDDVLTTSQHGSDLVVSVNSQRGGLSSSNSYIFKGNGFNANHSGSLKWNVVHSKLLDLLKSTSEFDFSYYGYGAISSTREIDSRADNLGIYYEVVPPYDSSFIRISTERVENEDYTHNIYLQQSDDVVLDIVFATLSDDKMIIDYGKDEMHFDMSGYENEVTLYAIGRTNYNAFVMDSVKVDLGEKTSIHGTIQDNKIKYLFNGQDLIIQDCKGPYKITVWDMLGHSLINQDNNPSHTYTLPDNNSVLIVKIKTKENVQTFKVLPATEKLQE